MTKTIAQLFDLSGQVAVVTGAAMGIGKGIALRLAEAGARVVITDVNMEAAAEAVKEISSAGGKARAVLADAAAVADAEKSVRAAVRELGDIHILVNNAGIFPFSPALEITEELWDRTIDINLKSMMFYSRAAAAAMVKAGHGGRIVNIASIDSFRPTGNLCHYDASKGGAVMLTKSLAREWAQYGILVNAIAPGGVSTPGAAAATARVSAGAVAAPEAFLASIPLRRMGTPDDIATVALFLASDASAYVTGATIVVDGGALLV